MAGLSPRRDHQALDSSKRVSTRAAVPIEACCSDMRLRSHCGDTEHSAFLRDSFEFVFVWLAILLVTIGAGFRHDQPRTPERV
jgi:hypothetical protein